MTALFPRTFELPAAPPPLSATDAAAALWLAPSTYIRLRRETAGLTHAQVAEKLVTAGTALTVERDIARLLIRDLEREGVTAKQPSALISLRCIFPLDPDIYWQLVYREGEPPRLCHTCGCSYFDSCQLGGHDSIDLCDLISDTLCSRCATTQAEGAAA